MKKDILKFNQDVLPAVYASCNYGHHGYGKENFKKCLSMLVAADIHGCKERMESAVCYLNEIPSLDCAIHLGDIQPSKFTDESGVLCTDAIKNAKKPFYVVIGNHDVGMSTKASIGSTKKQQFEKYFEPVKDVMKMPNLDKTYYSVNFDEYKVTLVVLDNYIIPDDRDENGDFKYLPSNEQMTQEQLEWFVNTLMQIPKDYHLIVARHSFDEPVKLIPCVWSQPNGVIDPEFYRCYGRVDIITTIIDAWINGKKLQVEYPPNEQYLEFETLKVDVDYGKRGKGVFVAHIIGHMHQDILAESVTYPNQKVIYFASSADDTWQNYCGDLPRQKGTKQEDCLTVFSVDTEKRMVKMVRIGSNITIDLIERKLFVLKY